MQSPFHEGERRAQDLAGERSIADGNGAMVRNRIAGGMLTFLRQQSMAVIGTQDSERSLWCSVVFGPPGFLHSDGAALDVELGAGHPIWNDIGEDRRVGVLVIDLATRKRMRVNGAALHLQDRMHIDVDEAFPNCAKYITRRQMLVGSFETSPVLDAPAGMASVAKADVLFVTTAHAERGLDTSHRGGSPGFVEVLSNDALRIPDYPGNSMFNTFGNLLLDARAGLAIPDFEARRLLQLSGTADVRWSEDDPKNLTGGTQRFWTFHIQERRESAFPEGLRSSFLDYSAFNPPVGR